MTRRSDNDARRLAESIERDIREIREALRRPLEAEYAEGRLTGPQRSVMQAVFRSSGLSLKELAAGVGLNHSTVSSIVDRLEGRGMILRSTDPEDRRITRISVTTGVRDFMRERAPALVSDPLARALAQAPEADRRAIRRGLQALRRVLEIESA